jgi:hypothetical protein
MDYRKLSSDDIPGARSNYGYDLAVNVQILESGVKAVYNPENFSTIEETNRWMEVRHAADILYIPKDEIPLLNHGKIEQAWAKAYRLNRQSAEKQATINAAAEMLLEYVDSAMQVTHTRAYYGKIINRARESLDAEARMERLEMQGGLMVAVGATMFAMTLFLAGAIWVSFTRNRDLKNPLDGPARAVMEGIRFTTLGNPEPTPDYSTRVRRTPTQGDLDRAVGYVPLEINRLHRQTEATLALQHESEDALTLQLLNEESERMRQEEAEAQRRRSTVTIVLESEATEEQKAQAAAAAAEAEALKAKSAAAWSPRGALKSVGDAIELVMDHMPEPPSKLHSTKSRLIDAKKLEIDERLKKRDSGTTDVSENKE